jgi:hypothetical protein
METVQCRLKNMQYFRRRLWWVRLIKSEAEQLVLDDATLASLVDTRHFAEAEDGRANVTQTLRMGKNVRCKCGFDLHLLGDGNYLKFNCCVAAAERDAMDRLILILSEARQRLENTWNVPLVAVDYSAFDQQAHVSWLTYPSMQQAMYDAVRNEMSHDDDGPN